MKFEFDEKNHRYYLGGSPLTGVTTVLGTIAKPALIQWSANMAVEYIKKNTNKCDKGVLDAYEYYLVTEQDIKKARTAHAQKRDKAADIGTLAHKWIENYVRGEDNPITDDIKPIVSNFLKWEKENNPKYLESELRVYSEKYWYAGTLDLILEIEGQTWLGDIKTGSGIYPEMWFQCAAYQLALQEMGKYPDIKGHIIINLRKDGKMNVQKSTDYKENRKAFLGALAIYRRLGQMK